MSPSHTRNNSQTHPCCVASPPPRAPAAALPAGALTQPASKPSTTDSASASVEPIPQTPRLSPSPHSLPLARVSAFTALILLLAASLAPCAAYRVYLGEFRQPLYASGVRMHSHRNTTATLRPRPHLPFPYGVRPDWAAEFGVRTGELDGYGFEARPEAPAFAMDRRSIHGRRRRGRWW